MVVIARAKIPGVPFRRYYIDKIKLEQMCLEDASFNKVCKEFRIEVHTLYKFCKEEYGCTFKQLKDRIKENGLITKSQEAKKLYTISSEKEGISAAVSASRIGDLESLELKNETLQKELDNQFGVGNAVATYDGDDTFTVEIKSTGNVYTIEDNQIIEGKYEKWDGTTSTEPTKNANKEIHIYTVSELKWLADQVNSGETFEEYKIYLENNLDLGARKENDTWDTENNRKVEFTN